MQATQQACRGLRQKLQAYVTPGGRREVGVSCVPEVVDAALDAMPGWEPEEARRTIVALQ